MSDINDWIEQVIKGDKEAFSEIYNSTIHPVYRTLYFLTDNKNDLDDIVQNIYAEIYRNLSKFDMSRSFHSWLYGIAIRQHQSYRREKWRQFRNEQKEFQLNSIISPDFSEASINKIHNKSIIDDIDDLSYKLKQVIILRYLNDFTQEQISEVLQIPIGTVKSRLHAALSKLRNNRGREMNV